MLRLLFALTLNAAPTFASESCPPYLSVATFLPTLTRVLQTAGVDEDTQQKIYSAAKDLDLREADIDATQIKIRRPFISRNPRRLILSWPNQNRLSHASDEVLTAKLAAVVGELLIPRLSTFGIYRQSSSDFVHENLKALTLKLFLEKNQFPENKISGMARFLRALRSPNARKLRLDQTVARLFAQGGSPAVYTYLRRFYGPPLALRYFVRHAQNLGVALSLGLVLYLAPTAAETWTLMRQESAVSVTRQDRAFAQEVLSHFKKTDAQMIEDIRSQSPNSEVLRKFLERYQTELQNERP